MSEPLKPCPFCGAAAKVSQPAKAGSIIRAGTIACTSLAGCFTPHVLWSDEGGTSLQDAARAWNNRPTP